MKYLLGYTTVPSETLGKKIAMSLIKNQLAACVHILPDTVSIFRWKHRIEEQKECILLFKTTEKGWKDAENCIQKHHTYECPCIVAFEISNGSKIFLDWVQESTVAQRKQKRVRGEKK